MINWRNETKKGDDESPLCKIFRVYSLINYPYFSVRVFSCSTDQL